MNYTKQRVLLNLLQDLEGGETKEPPTTLERAAKNVQEQSPDWIGTFKARADSSLLEKEYPNIFGREKPKIPRPSAALADSEATWTLEALAGSPEAREKLKALGGLEEYAKPAKPETRPSLALSDSIATWKQQALSGDKRAEEKLRKIQELATKPEKPKDTHKEYLDALARNARATEAMGKLDVVTPDLINNLTESSKELEKKALSGDKEAKEELKRNQILQDYMNSQGVGKKLPEDVKDNLRQMYRRQIEETIPIIDAYDAEKEQKTTKEAITELNKAFPPEDSKGKTKRDTVTNKWFKSNGTNWIERKMQ